MLKSVIMLVGGFKKKKKAVFLSFLPQRFFVYERRL